MGLWNNFEKQGGSGRLKMQQTKVASRQHHEQKHFQENDKGIVSHHHITEWLDVGGGRAGAAENTNRRNAQRIGDADSKDQRAEDHVVHHNKNKQGQGIVEINEQPTKDKEQDQQSDNSVHENE